MHEGLEEIARSISAARRAKNLTQKQLGERVGLPQSHISKIEKGSVNLQVSSLVEIARALDLELSLIPRGVLPAVEAVTHTRRHPTLFTGLSLKELGDRFLLPEDELPSSLPRPAFRLEDDE